MTDKILIDTNLWIYLYASNPQAKRRRVQELIQQNFEKVILSPQILGELYHVVTRKIFQPRESAKQIILEMITTFPVLESGTADVLEAIKIHETYNYSYWDSLVIATALLNGCETVYSEDMQHNQSIEGKTRIINPFL
jgi:predicted nucleic acid-binding protein